ncbi:hypothetical protein PUNSTDRAFT_140330 [Punctularia strigosozonata HHB-11173 SS5]|uniref:uncharacterized protein n=1 Tax=Punctularia strigosozonata (strain HHB-11173) TaxID=741275 RepID=UPI00044178A0|nr:uncharacterized protein PUNSTDRAFT_140330 [Punctularia strigosozonata HHB-11173 SS5]EIN13894.1 hypothetical protein PUNSTDRAFT_140330 [Punctularia strigosozonata HHB-11173 SS5]
MSLIDRTPSLRWFRRSKSSAATLSATSTAIHDPQKPPIFDNVVNDRPEFSANPSYLPDHGSGTHLELEHALARSATASASASPNPTSSYHSRPLPPLPVESRGRARFSVGLDDPDPMLRYTQSDIGHGGGYLASRTFTEPDSHSNPLTAISTKRPRKLKKPEHARLSSPDTRVQERPRQKAALAPHGRIGSRSTSALPLSSLNESPPPKTPSAPSLLALAARLPSFRHSHHNHPKTSTEDAPTRRSRPQSVPGAQAMLAIPNPTRSGAGSRLSSGTAITVASTASSSTSAAMYFGSASPPPKSPSAPTRKLTKRRPQPTKSVTAPIPASAPEISPPVSPVTGVYPSKIITNYSRPFSMIDGVASDTRLWQSVSENGHGYSSPPMSPVALSPYKPAFHSITVLGHGAPELEEHDSVISPNPSIESLPRLQTAALLDLSLTTSDDINVSSSAIAARSSLLHAADRSGSQRDIFVLDPKWTIGEEGEDEVEQDGIRARGGDFDPYCDLNDSPPPLVREDSTAQTSTEGSLMTPPTPHDFTPLTSIPTNLGALSAASAAKAQQGVDELGFSSVAKPRPQFDSDRCHPLRRWTLAMAEAPDEVVAQEFELLRKVDQGRRSRKSSMARTMSAPISMVDVEEDGTQDDDEPEHTLRMRTSLLSLGALGVLNGAMVYGGPNTEKVEDLAADEDRSSDEDEAGWENVRKAILSCKDLIRTERAYQAKLCQLIDGETATPPPPLMQRYLPALINASQALLARLSEDPSAWGVSAAFVGIEEQLEQAFVAWCGIVGEFFIDRPQERMVRKIVKTPPASLLKVGSTLRPARPRTRSGKIHIERADTSPAASLRAKRRLTQASAARESRSFDMKRVEDESWPDSPTRSFFSATFGNASSAKLNPAASSGSGAAPYQPRSLPTVRELAIQPVQRVMRYVLHYRDLLSYTPANSPSRSLIERALQVAERIAQKCDRAQDNSSFLLRR